MPSDTPGPFSARDSSSDALIVFDDQDRVIEATRLACDLMGYSREDLLSRSLKDLAAGSEALEANRLLGRLQEEAMIAFEAGLRVKDGSTQAFHLRLSKLSVAGRRHSLVRVARRRRAADKLPEDPDFVRSLLDTPGTFLLVLDPEGRIVFFNKACEAATGYSFREVRGKRFWELVPGPAEAERLTAAFADLDRGGFPARMEQEWRTKEGKPLAVSWSSTLLLRPDGTVRHLIVTGLEGSGTLPAERRRLTPAPEIESERKLVEEALRESEERFRRFAENAEDLIYRYRLSPQPAYDYLSPAVLKMTGYTAQEYYGDPELGLKVVHPNDRHLIEEIVSSGRLPDKPLTLRWIRKDGRELWMEQRNVAVRDASGRIVAIEGIARDITDRRRTERCQDALYGVTRILAESTTFEQAAPRILQALHRCFDWEVGAIWLVDPTANELRLAELWHPETVQVPEFDALTRSISFRLEEGIPGAVWMEGKAVWIPDVARESRLPRGPIAAKEGLHAALGFPVTLGGEVLGVLEFFSFEILPPDEEILNILGSIGSQIGQFIERRRAELRQSTQYGVTRILAEARTFDAAAPGILEEVCKSLGWEVGAVWLVDRPADVLRMSVLWRGPGVQIAEFASASRLSTLRKGVDLAGRVWEAARPLWIHDLASHPEFLLSQAAAREGLHGCFGFPILLGDEILGVLEFLSREIRQPDAQMLAMIGAIGSQIGQFIERKAVEAEVRSLNEGLERRVEERTAQLGEAVREMASFTYTIAHDLRAPLRSMSGFAQAMVDDFGSTMDPTCADYARRVAASARKMDELIRDLLAYGRLIHLEIRIETVDLNSLFQSVLERMAAELSRRNAVVRVVGALGKVRGNGSMLLQVLTNLLSNAIKFVARGVQPRVTVWSEPRDDRVCLWVEDNGIGIAPEFQKRIFGIFERLNREEDYPGTGIGLAIVRKALERMGGRSGVDSSASKGSRFWVELPAA